MLGRPLHRLGVLVGLVVVQDEMHRKALGDVAVDGAQEDEELLATVLGQALTRTLPVATSRAANRAVVPVALVVVGIVPARPLTIGSEGWVRSRGVEWFLVGVLSTGRFVGMVDPIPDDLLTRPHPSCGVTLELSLCPCRGMSGDRESSPS